VPALLLQRNSSHHACTVKAVHTATLTSKSSQQVVQTVQTAQL